MLFSCLCLCIILALVLVLVFVLALVLVLFLFVSWSVGLFVGRLDGWWVGGMVGL